MKASAKHFRRRAVVASLYTPWLSRHRPRREAGFMVRVRDPRVPHGWQAAPVRRARWRWLKVFVAWTNPALVDKRGRVLTAEVETHLTDGVNARLTYKTFARVKLALGAPKGS